MMATIMMKMKINKDFKIMITLIRVFYKQGATHLHSFKFEINQVNLNTYTFI